MKTTSVPIEVMRDRLSYEEGAGLLRWKYAISRSVKPGQIAGTLKNDGYINILINRITMKAHRIAWAIHYGSLPDGFIDHINGIKSDNRISNLRVADNYQNQWNRHYSGSSTGFKGVSKLRSGAFRSNICLYGKTIYIGTYKTAEDAARSYDEKAKVLFGEFAWLNFQEVNQCQS